MVEKTTIVRKPGMFINILMYKTAVYTLVNGAITHQNPQIWKNVILHCMTLP